MPSENKPLWPLPRRVVEEMERTEARARHAPCQTLADYCRWRSRKRHAPKEST